MEIKTYEETTSEGVSIFFERCTSRASKTRLSFYEELAEEAKKHGIKIKILKESDSDGMGQGVSFISFDELKDI